ncbi:MAG TPA: CPBP family glutamic-type intramembrane protease [Blastocatellia bacterium]|jgi:hypothetical protein|nr:CPBP family glutamic-type intramembrane protease [Blastocatellia bacterium]
MAAKYPTARIADPTFGPGAPLPLSRRAAACELACLVLLIETIMWVVPLVANARPAYAGLVFVILVLLVTCCARDRLSARELGLRFDNLPGVLRRLAPPLGAFVLLTVATGLAVGSLRFGPKFFSMLATVPLWALVQQYMLLAFSNRRLRVIFGEGRSSILATAALFSLLHLPNPILTLACAAGGYVWASEYERAPNLFANALTHTMASAFLANSLPRGLLKNMVVGYNYFLR